MCSSVSAHHCFQAENERTPPFRDDNSSGRLPSGSQAIISSYKFGCCGNITAWQTYVQPGGSKHQRAYDITFQVWRPSPTVQDNGCYSLVGENRFTSIFLGIGGLVSETPEPSNIISVQPGDVVGYYTFSRKDYYNFGMEGIQLDSSYNIDSVWYFTDDNDGGLILRPSNCPFPIGTQSDRILTYSTNAAPVLAVYLCKLTVTYYDNICFK